MACRPKREVAELEPLIRESLALGYSAPEVARAVGCSRKLVRRIRDGQPRGTPGPKPGQRCEEDGEDVAVPVETEARMQRALRHWLKNEEDMSCAEVAEMYDVSDSALRAARARHEGR
ncbi:hypothetical protein Mx9_p57 [Myxococcus phage Mx9]|nr:hypothetical protein Mx9_p57 [Myxococcus phage Mx9]